MKGCVLFFFEIRGCVVWYVVSFINLNVVIISFNFIRIIILSSYCKRFFIVLKSVKFKDLM